MTDTAQAIRNENIAFAQASIDLHTKNMLIDSGGEKSVPLWHLLVSLRTWSRANGVDFDGEVDSVKEFEQGEGADLV